MYTNLAYILCLLVTVNDKELFNPILKTILLFILMTLCTMFIFTYKMFFVRFSFYPYHPYLCNCAWHKTSLFFCFL